MKVHGVRRCFRGPARGFTLVELVAVVALTAILSIAAYAAVSTTVGTFKLNAAATKMIEDIRYAQHLARTHNGWYGVLFQPNPANQYTVYQTDGTTDTAVTNPLNPVTTLSINTNTDYGVTITIANIGGGTQVEFNPMGVPYNDKTGAALAANGTVTLTRGGSSKTITIIQNTGKAE